MSLRGGGCALNTASALARLGVDAACAGKVGGDVLGEFLLALLDGRGVGRVLVARDAAAATSASVVLVDSAGERTFLHVPGASAALRAEELDVEALLAGRALHLAGALVMPALDGEPSARLLAAARRRGVHTSLDTVWDATGGWERLEPCLPHLDLLCASGAEAAALTGEDDPAAAAEALRRRGAGTVAVKLGSAGCVVAAAGYVGAVPAPRVEPVDGTGAGDAFAAGLLYGRLAGWPLEPSARLACALGAAATTAVGASERLPALDEALELAGLAARA